MSEVFVAGNRVRLDAGKLIGSGGEADVYHYGSNAAIKIFKTPKHPDYAGNALAQTAAAARIAEHQRKLKQFPKRLPGHVVCPQALVTDQTGQSILGYVMPFLNGSEVLLRYGDRTFRQGVPTQDVLTLFRDLFTTVQGLHAASVVIGDFNDLNVLVRNTEAHVIDVDSMQFGSFPCRVFTERFVDPLKCDPRESRLLLVRPHDAPSDWYAYAIMLMQSLLFVGPYGGIYRPKDPKKRLNHDERPLHRITVFHPEVQYPKPALPLKLLPDDLLQYFERTFVHDARGEFPVALLESLRWQKCTVCGTEHGRSTCPECQKVAPAAVKQTVVVRGNVTATRVFQTRGLILRVAVEGKDLRYLYHEREAYRREGGAVVFPGALDPHLRVRVQGKSTLVAKDGQAVTIDGDVIGERFSVDTFRHLPTIDTNADHRYWIDNGQLFRNGDLGRELIGDILEHQTMFYVGSKFGFGFYRASGLTRAFLFGARSRGINDSVKITPIIGQLMDASCVFTRDHVWFLTKTESGGKVQYRIEVIRSSGEVDAVLTAPEGTHPWMSSFRGACGAGDVVLVPTDDGIVRLEAQNNTISKTKEFPDTEPFVSSDSRLLPGQNGLYVVSRNEITHIALR